MRLFSKCLITAVFALTLLISTSCAEKIDPAKLPDGSDVKTVNGLRILHLNGTHEENGLKTGKAFRARIQFINNGYMKTFLKLTGGKENALVVARKFEEFIPERFKEEMRGIATGAELPYDDILLLNCFMEVYKMGCTNHIAWGDMTKDNKLIHGRNIDFPDKDQGHLNMVILAYEIEGKEKVLSITWPGMVGILTGMNESKLCLAINELFDFDPTIQSMPYPLFYRIILEDCKTLAEAEKMLMDMKPNTPNIVVVSSGKELTAIEAEVIPGQGTAIVKPDDNWLTVANSAISTKFRQKDCDRRKTSIEFMKTNKGEITVDLIKELLNKATLGELNILSVVMKPEEMELEIAYEKLPASQGPWHKLKWSDCFSTQ